MPPPAEARTSAPVPPVTFTPPDSIWSAETRVVLAIPDEEDSPSTAHTLESAAASSSRVAGQSSGAAVVVLTWVRSETLTSWTGAVAPPPNLYSVRETSLRAPGSSRTG